MVLSQLQHTSALKSVHLCILFPDQAPGVLKYEEYQCKIDEKKKWLHDLGKNRMMMEYIFFS